MRQPHDYSSLKEAHSEANHGSPEQAPAQPSAELTPHEKLEAKYEQLNADLLAKHENGRIDAREFIHDQRQLDNAQEMEMKKLAKEEAKSAAPESENTDAKQARADRMARMPGIPEQQHAHSSESQFDLGREHDD